MSQFDDVSVIREANVYFDGRVTSRTLLFDDGSRKTLGVMLPGEYEFGTAEKEVMEILAGDLEVRLPDAEWVLFTSGQIFEVPANSRFHVKADGVVDYCCSYIS